MSADGELYISEDCADYFEKDLDCWFGKGEWRLDASEFSDYWNMAEFPKMVFVKVIDNKHKQIGEVVIYNKFEIQEDGFEHRSIFCEPDRIMTKEEWKANEVVKKL